MIPYATPEDLRAWANARMQRAPDYVIGDPSNPYMRRWWIVPRSAGCNVYLHEILKSDEDRAGHDHPWSNTSFVIDGEYEEVTYFKQSPWIEAYRYMRRAGGVVSRDATDTHRLILPEGGRAISLFMTGPKVRDWGYWCPNGERFVPWRIFNAGEHGELVGKGCAE